MDVKFRGLTEAGEWVYGDLIHNRSGETHICNDCACLPFKVIPETVGQLKGYDKNGKEIYVGDRIRYKNLTYIIEQNSQLFWDIYEVIGNIHRQEQSNGY
jgi:hypothetical protein